MSDEDHPEPDHIHVEGECPTGGLHAVAMKNGRVMGAGHAQVAKDGQAMLPGQTLYHIDHDGKVVSAVRAPGVGPAKVSTPAFRNGWDRIFGDRPVGQA